MKNKLTIALLICVLLSHNSRAQTPFTVGHVYNIKSTDYDLERKINVFTPQGYDSTKRDYPVLYVLDGQRWFLQAVSYQRIFHEYSYTPDFIVVGINTEDSGRYGFFRDTEKLSRLIEKDIVPFIEESFRTTEERFLFGWQFAGAFALKVLSNQAELFDAVFVASPIPIDQNDNWDFSEPRTLLITTSETENAVNEGVKKFTDKLQGNSSSLRWIHKVSKLESISSFGHRTTPLSALYYGLRFYFDDYTLLEFDHIEDFYSTGGHDYVKEYYVNRGKKYGLPEEVPIEGMFFLLRMGLDENDYSSFKKFMSEFIEKGVLADTNLGWGARYAEFSLQNEDHALARSIYQTLSDRFPDNALPIHGLGKVLLAQNDKKEARRKFELAVEIAKKSNDRRLAEYQKDLDAIKR